jgi:hypothetical protein
MSANKLEFVLYQNPMAIENLDAIGIADSDDSLVIELSASSIFAPVFDQQAKLRFGLAGLLGDAERVSTLPRAFRSSRRKILLGSRPSVPVQSSVGALAELKRMDTDFERMIVMLHLSEVDKFIYGLQLASTFCILLRYGDAVPAGLLRAVDRLAKLKALDGESWKGLAFYGQRPESSEGDLVESLPDHLRPLLVPAAPVDSAA